MYKGFFFISFLKFRSHVYFFIPKRSHKEIILFMQTHKEINKMERTKNSLVYHLDEKETPNKNLNIPC